MAVMIPQLKLDEDFNNSPAERKVYEHLSQLPDDYRVFYSVEWLRKDNYDRILYGEADFMVYIPGRGLLVIEVKGGEIFFRDDYIIQRNRRDGTEKRQKPLAQSRKSVYKFRDILNASLDIRVPVEPIVWFPDCCRSGIEGDLPHNYDEHILLTRDSFASLQEVLENACDYYGMHINHGDDGLGQRVTELLAPEFHAVLSPAAVAEYNDRIFLQMTRQQGYLIDYLEEVDYALIQGGAGTGKTMLAVEKARQLNARQEPTLFLMFNKMLEEDLKEHYAQDMKNVKFTNIYKFVAKALGREVDAKEISTFLKNVPKHGNWPYKHIIIDEGQDFADWNKYLYDIAKSEHGSCYIFYDKNQLVQQRDLSWVNMFECRLVLSRNCRNTRAIAETSGSPLGLRNIKMRREDIGKGADPRMFIFRKNKEYLKGLQSIIEYYLNQDLPADGLVLISLKKLEDSPIYQAVYNHPHSGLGKLVTLDRKEKGKVFLTTSRKFKGLESTAVVIVDISAETFANEESRRNFYVGTSRAKSFLELMACLSEEDEAEMVANLGGEASNLPRFALMRNLNIVLGNINSLG